MAEIKEPRSAFAAHEKDIVQEWLDHPCTKELAEWLGDASSRAKDAIVEFSMNVQSTYPSDAVAAKLRKDGAILATFTVVHDLLTEAQRYANS
jgi:hypothetical protein